ncbi:RNA-binding S4 domain-containing protein [Syntrophomonas palmitatica]|uniref:RNA-binding S4 domain-containing protein n=1 Tax=Syntrophomonas palmitatica TaxID=402877 RepID=UPI0006D128E6|nr:RNA-binding S4 domain-containing protein [Syntrophomonas palmitatica]
MRLDKYLKVSRIIKRRSVAKDFAENERVLVNGRVAKPSTEVKKGDILTIQVGERQTVFEILDIKENVKAAEAKNLYRVLE